MKDWKEYPLKDITTKIGSGSTPKGGKESYISSGITLVRSLNIYDFEFSYKELAFINEKQAKKLNGVTIEKNDVLLNITGASVGRCTIIPDKLIPARVNQHVSIIRAEKSLLDPHFLLYSINAPFYKEALMMIADSGSTREALTKEDIQKFKIKLPSLPTQQRIASILSAYDDLIEVNNQRIKLLEQTARELYKEWFVRMRFPGYKQANFKKGVPEGWEVKPISAIVKFLSGYSFKSSFYTANGKFGIVTIKNVQDGHFISDCTDYIEALPKKLKEYCILKTGDVLMSLTGNVGRVCHVIGDNILLNQRVAKLKPLISDKTHYIYCFFRENSMIQYMENISLGSTAQMNLSPIQLGKQKVIVPDSHLIKRFDEMVDPYFQNKYQLIRANEMLREIRDRLLPRLISGKLQVKEPTNKKALMA